MVNLYTINIKAVLEIRNDDGVITARLLPETDLILNKVTNNADTNIIKQLPQLHTEIAVKIASPSPNQAVVRQNSSNAKNNVTEFLSDELFYKFWEVYPRKEKKKDAYRIWKRDKLELVGQDIIDDVRHRQLTHDRWADVSFIPLPTTYLSGEGWNDQIIKRVNNEHRRDEQQTEISRRLNHESKRERQIREGLDKYERIRGKG